MMLDRQWFVLYVLVCLEIGLFLTLVPWSAIWERNYFLEAYPGLRPYMLAPTLRGAVCGLGLANIYLGISEVLNRWRASIERQELEEELSRHRRRDDRLSPTEVRNVLVAPEDS